MTDIDFMREALCEAEKAFAAGEVPVGAVMAYRGEIIARAHNEREFSRDPTAHAEMLAIRRAAAVLDRRRLDGATLYVTLEPCPMCAGAILQSGMDRLVYGARDEQAGCAGSVYRITEDPAFLGYVPAFGGVLREECADILRRFFAAKRGGSQVTTRQILDDAASWLEAHSEEMIADLQEFARIPSVSRPDLAKDGAPFGEDCAKMLACALQKAEAYGFQTENHDGYCGSAIWGDPENAIGIFGHLDVVPEGDKWIYPPYGATRNGDFLIGRGVSDNKSACTLALTCMRYFKDRGIPLRHGVRAVFGCSEEIGMADMAHFRAHVPMPVVSLVPDASFPVNYAQKGMLRGRVSVKIGDDVCDISGGEVMNMVPPNCSCLLRIPYEKAKDGISGEGVSVSEENGNTRVRATGKASHAASPENGVSAIHALARAVADAKLLSESSQKAFETLAALSNDIYGTALGIACEDPESGKTTMTVGIVRKPEEGTMLFSIDSRLSIASELPKIRAAFDAYCAGHALTNIDVALQAPFYMPKDDPRVTCLMDVYREATGRDDAPYTMGGGTYSKELTNALTFGPGFPGSEHRPDDLPAGHGGAHAPDEFLYIPDMLRAMPLYAAAILKLDEIV